MSTRPPSLPAGPPAGPLRRLAVLVYDGLLLVAVLFLATLLLLPLTDGEAILAGDPGPAGVGFSAFVALLTLGFFGFSWIRRGQTLGMMSWRVRLERQEGRRIGWAWSALRVAIGYGIVASASAGLWLASDAAGGIGGRLLPVALLAPLAANYLWMAFDAESRTLQDVLTRSRMVRLA